MNKNTRHHSLALRIWQLEPDHMFLMELLSRCEWQEGLWKNCGRCYCTSVMHRVIQPVWMDLWLFIIHLNFLLILGTLRTSPQKVNDFSQDPCGGITLWSLALSHKEALYIDQVISIRIVISGCLYFTDQIIITKKLQMCNKFSGVLKLIF